MCLLGAGALSCSAPREVETLTLTLRGLAGCELGPPSSVQLRALGDFAPIDRRVASESMASAFSGLPPQTRELLVTTRSGETTGVGRRILPDVDDARPLLVLPAGRSCPLGDPGALALEGAAVAALSSGGFFVAGGWNEDGSASAAALTYAPGAALSQLAAKSMFLRRAYATATPVGSTIIVAGGTASAAAAHETYEVFDTATRGFEGARAGHMLGPRMEHAAISLQDGHVLLVGGRAQVGGSALASAELLDVDAGSSIELETRLARPRIRPVVLRLDSGSVWVLGGREADGAPLLDSVERFDVASRRFSQLSAVTLPVRDEAVVAALPGARVAWFACDAQPSSPCVLSLLSERDGEVSVQEVPLEASSDPALGLSSLRMVALDTGRLLVTASVVDPTINRRAFLIDLNRSSIERLADVSRVPTELLLLRTGTVAEFDTTGVSLREQESLSAYDSIDGNLIVEQPSRLALDVATHWQRSEAGLTARVDARLDVPKLSFSDVRVELDASGDLALLFVDDAGHEQVVERVSDMVRVAECKRPVQVDARLIAERSGSRLRLEARPGGALCEVAGGGSVRVALRADRESVIRELRVVRL